MNNQINVQKKELSIKNLITIGVFSALYFVFYMIGGIPFGINPVTTFYQPMGSALLCGPIFMFLIAKVHKRWSITILGIILGFLLFITGMHWAMAIGTVVMGILAEFIAGCSKYKSKKINIFSYMIFSLGQTGSFLVYFINPVSWTNAMLKKGTQKAYIDTMNASFKPWMIYVIIFGTLIVAAFSGWIGSKMLRKQFEKAGIVE